MSFLALIIALELVLSTSIVGLSSHKISNVLGIQKIAQVDDSADNSAPADATNPSSEPSPIPSSPESTSTTPTPDQSSSSSQTSQDSTTPKDIQPLFEQEINPGPNSQNQGVFSNPQPLEETPAKASEEVTQTQAVLNSDDLINSPDNISNQSISEAKKEDEQINQISDPKEQTLTLINFATDKVKDMNNFTTSDDFSSTNFAAARFNDQLDKAISNLEKLPQKDQIKLKQQLVNFCSQADQVLRTIELSVPQESEQDIQIARGQCQELEL